MKFLSCSTFAVFLSKRHSVENSISAVPIFWQRLFFPLFDIQAYYLRLQKTKNAENARRTVLLQDGQFAALNMSFG